jgi:hypothetical protein
VAVRRTYEREAAARGWQSVYEALASWPGVSVAEVLHAAAARHRGPAGRVASGAQVFLFLHGQMAWSGSQKTG